MAGYFPIKPGLWAANPHDVDDQYKSLWDGLYCHIPLNDLPGNGTSLTNGHTLKMYGSAPSAPFLNGAPFTVEESPFGPMIRWGAVDNGEGIEIPGDHTAPLMVGSDPNWSAAVLFTWNGDTTDEKTIVSQEQGGANGHGFRVRLDDQTSDPAVIEVISPAFFGAARINSNMFYLFFIQGANNGSNVSYEAWMVELDTGIVFGPDIQISARSMGTDPNADPILFGAQAANDDSDGLGIVGTWVWNRRLTEVELPIFFLDPWGMIRQAPILPVAPTGDATAVLTAIQATVTIDAVTTTTSAQANLTAINAAVTIDQPTTTTSATAVLVAIAATVTIDTVTTTTSATAVLVAINVLATIDQPTTTTSATTVLTAIAAIVTMPAVTAIVTGDATATLTAIAANVTIPTVVTTTSATVVLTAVNVVVTMPAVTALGGGDVIATLTAIAAVVTIDQPVVTADVTAVLTSIAAVVTINTVTTTTSATAVLTAINAVVTIPSVATTTTATAVLTSVNAVVTLPAVVATGGATVVLTAITATVTIDQPVIRIGADVALVAIQASVTIPTVVTTTSATAVLTSIAVVVTFPTPGAFVQPAAVLKPPLTAEIHGDDGRSFATLSDHGNAIAHVADDAGESHADVTDGAITRVDRI